MSGEAKESDNSSLVGDVMDDGRRLRYAIRRRGGVGKPESLTTTSLKTILSPGN